MRKITFPLAALAAPLSLINLSSASASSLEGPYIGLGTAIATSYHYELEADVTTGLLNQSDTNTVELRSGHLGSMGSSFDILLGGGATTESIYYGFELFYSAGNSDEELLEADLESDDVEATATVEVQDGYGVSLRLGYLHTSRSMAYLKTVYTEREFEGTLDIRAGDNSESFSESGNSVDSELALVSSCSVRTCLCHFV
ncbi:hypothetical protein HH1059_02930 [Halorhodospira halochloris]|uniref:Outer membrane protein beta-barrel domain-containing protein n=1 Tax=Halorhodospira halochloris TaxID=1052 RepID=A0A2Z6EZ81_HALHR|nr:hypothetical protein [Halorhodospira halochloris]MBK1652239.1 hypothetical protein [Halorhodospira halochloris]BBE10950.1 hypothetical protein HH1059_02930 [Halorhodospira halochloris]